MLTVTEIKGNISDFPKKPLGFLPFRFKHNFWKQEFTGEVWRGNHYMKVSGKDSFSIISVMIVAWKRFSK